MKRLLPWVTLSLAGCIADAQELIELPLQVAGTRVEGPVLARDDVEITLTDARLAFGPLYLCAGTSAGELCETARAEWTESTVVDALDPEPREAGMLTGVSGDVRSFMYDLGFTSLLTEEDPLPLDAATALGGASVRLAGTALIGSQARPFEASIRIAQEEETERGIPVIRSGAGDRIDHVLGPDDTGLRITFDPRPWLADAEFLSLFEDGVCELEGPPIVCAGTVEQVCAADGSTMSTRDCSEEAEHCIAGFGCAASYAFDPEQQPYRAARLQIVSGAAPVFSWSPNPN